MLASLTRYLVAASGYLPISTLPNLKFSKAYLQDKYISICSNLHRYLFTIKEEIQLQNIYFADSSENIGANVTQAGFHAV